MHMHSRLNVVLFLLFSSTAAAAAPADTARQLKLLPAPKKVELREGRFAVLPGTRILIGAAHFREDRVAAEMLVEEIREQGGPKLSIELNQAPPSGAGTIVLGRLEDSGVRALVKSDGSVAREDVGDQGYLLIATKSHIVVAAATGQGLFYGVQTLRQLLRPAGKSLICPAVSIQDWPSMRWRGMQDDISRGPIPTLDYMKKQIRTLAAYKVNLFALYMENVFDYQSQPLLGPKEGAFTPAELKELVSYAQKHYVTILPEQQSFGHLHNVLKYDLYSDLGETLHGQVLSPANEKSYELIGTLFGELAPVFPGPFLHIGADETFELGRGQTKTRAEQVGLGRVYLDHLQRVWEILKPYHKRLIFWGDVAVDYPQLLTTLPKDMIAMPWNYEARASFEDILIPFKNAGLDIIVAPGASNWSLIWPNFGVGLVNIRNFVRDGQKYGALGMLNTTWNDDGEALMEMCWPALVFGAAAGWQPGESSIADFKQSYDWAFYRNPESTFSEAMDELDEAHTLLTGVGAGDAGNGLFWANPFTERGAQRLQKAAPAARKLRLAAEQALSSLYRNRGKARTHGETVDAMILAAWRLDTLGMKIEFTEEMNRYYWESYLHPENRELVLNNFDEITGNARLEDLRDAMMRLRAMQEKAWQKEYRPCWMGNVLLRYDRMAGLLESTIQAVNDAAQQYQEQKTLPVPQALGFFLKP
jgi:hexosaminidase